MKLHGLRRQISSPLLRLCDWLLALYPPRFQGEFASEMRSIILLRIAEAGERNVAAWLAAVLREVTGLALSILREQQHARLSQKEQAMDQGNQVQMDARTSGGELPPMRLAGGAGVKWLAGWTLLTTAAIPAALIVVAPLAVLFMGLSNLGAWAGFWPVVSGSSMQALGAVVGLALALSTAQWVLLRRLLPRAGLWFLATGAGVLLGSIAAGLIVWRTALESRGDVWTLAAALLPIGLALGLAKQQGIYPTPQEAVIGKNSQGWGGAEVVRIEGVWAEPNRRDAQPHVWFGGGVVYLDRVPKGYDKASYSAGSFYLRVREGWVHVPEGACPEFIGWVIELYNLEGVRQFAAQP